MNKDLEQLARIYNTLALVNTRGEDTIVMGDCLRALKQYIEAAEKDSEESHIQEANTEA